MQRIDTATKFTDLFGAGKHGFRDGDLGLGINPTQFSADYCNDIQEELMSIIEGAGVAPSTAVVTQIRQAINRMFGGNVTTVNFAASPFALTADHAGLVLIDATGGNVVLNLPAANVVTALPINYVFEKVDASANTVTGNRAGANTIEGATSFVLTTQYANLGIRSNAVDTWFRVSGGTSLAVASTAEAQALTDNTKAITSLRLKESFQGSNQSLAASGYQKLPGGLIMQWGSSAMSGSVSSTISLPISFPTAFLRAFATCVDNNVSDASGNAAAATSSGLSSITLSNSDDSPRTVQFLALGY